MTKPTEPEDPLLREILQYAERDGSTRAEAMDLYRLMLDVITKAETAISAFDDCLTKLLKLSSNHERERCAERPEVKAFRDQAMLVNELLRDSLAIAQQDNAPRIAAVLLDLNSEISRRQAAIDGALRHGGNA